MAPPPGSGVSSSSDKGKKDIPHIPFVIPVEGYDPPPLGTNEHNRKTAESLERFSRDFPDSQDAEGKIILAQWPGDGSPKDDKDTNKFGEDADKILFQGSNDYQLLAKGLSLLVDGKINDAKVYLDPLRNKPIAQELFQHIDKNDNWLVSMETLFILKALCEDEILAKSETPEIPRIKSFLDEVESRLKSGEEADLQSLILTLSQDPSKNYSDFPDLLRKLAGGVGGKIIDTTRLPRDTARGMALIGIVNRELLPNNRAGASYVIARILKDHPEVREQARGILAELNGLKTSPHRIIMEIFDQGGTSFFASWLALAPSRWAARWTWAFWAKKYSREMSLGRKVLGLGAAWGAGTGAFIISEKALLGLSGFDGQILPLSGGEALREFAGDMVITGMSNMLGGATRWLTKDRPIVDTVTRRREFRWFFKVDNKDLGGGIMKHQYSLRTPFKVGLHAVNFLGQPLLLHYNYRWQDHTHFVSRFRPGKPTYFMPQSSEDILLRGYEVKSAERLLGELLNHSLKVRFTKNDKISSRILALKKWIVKADPAVTKEQEETLLGVLWVSQERGVFGCVEGSKKPCSSGGAPDILLRWTKQKRYEKVNEYFQKHKIPVKVTPEGEFQLVE